MRGLEDWLESQPQWLQHAARLFHEQGKLSDQDYAALADRCKREAQGDPGADGQFREARPAVFAEGVAERSRSLRLKSIENVEAARR